MDDDSGGLALRLERALPAEPARVFAACVEPDELAEWWGAAGFGSHVLELDAREGGRYRIRMQPPDAEAFHLRGEVVGRSFLDDENGTKVVLDQGPFATGARHALHEAGWTETLDRLERRLME